MPIAKKAAAPKVEEAPVVEPVVEPTVEDAPVEQTENKVVKSGSLVKCQLVKGSRLYQSSTRTHIYRGEITELKADGWLSLQVKAGLIELVG